MKKKISFSYSLVDKIFVIFLIVAIKNITKILKVVKYLHENSCHFPVDGHQRQKLRTLKYFQLVIIVETRSRSDTS
jgi:hypothetical protein